MPNKKKGNDKKGGGRGGGNTWQKDENDVQAIIVADSFNRKFTPITQELPRALLPLGNKRIIDYTIQYLLDQGIQEIIVFCCSLGEKIREYINQKWVEKSKCHIHCVMSSTSDCISLGDALREIDREGLIRSDFVLVPGDLISNVKLSDIIKKHKIKRKKEKNLVMTILQRVLQPGHFSRSPEDNAVLTIEKDTNRVLHCQKSQQCKQIFIPTSVLSNRTDVNIHYDLSPCQISICSPQVAPLFTDNFDYQNLDDFIKGILINEEILGDQVHACIVHDCYSARVNDLHMYNAISLDLMNRWIYPLVPDSVTCHFRRNNIYLEDDVRMEKNCQIIESVIIGKSTTVGEGTKVSNSVIGSNCRIGKNVHINNSYIWDNVTIEDDVDITQSVVCTDCIVKRSSKLIDSVISFKVCVGANMKLAPSTRLSLLRPENIEDQFGSMDLKSCEDRPYDVSVVGVDGQGYTWPCNDDDEEDVIPSLTGNDYNTSDESSDDDEDENSLPPTPPVETSNLYQFYLEVTENLRCGITEKISADNIALEINASKFKFNISIPELCQTVVKALLELSVKDTSRTKQDMAKDLDKIMTTLQPLLEKYYNCPDTQLQAIVAAEEYFASNLNIGAVFATFLHKMYDKDLLDENVILKWYKNPPIAEEFSMQDNFNELRENQTLIKLITWLEEAEEEESDEESD
ncbi:translation initiation factor eIF-2B subunit epsilon-like [Hydractinia symbiolongicarpus]|uniref:translation initiation factor eIF-2B subunit epsilon-like n=1 Tax=Hydractinia symbiolongicarpus TaxID=13093 RepID=UPI00254B64FA|nr:translation initiation factor eIF-2B subunit epsilon-like [Hydractinia symbiolongicarpus]